MNMAGRTEILHLYRTMMRESNKFTAYNFREYAKRRVRDGFKEGAAMKDTEMTEKLLKTARDNLKLLERQTVISSMYCGQKSVIEDTKG